jgi:hypothetical protein
VSLLVPSMCQYSVESNNDDGSDHDIYDFKTKEQEATRLQQSSESSDLVGTISR